jgi:hypothetical protein
MILATKDLRNRLKWIGGFCRKIISPKINGLKMKKGLVLVLGMLIIGIGWVSV